LFDIIDNEDPNDRFMVAESENVTQKKGWFFSSLVCKNKYNIFKIDETDTSNITH
jgi:hypothetical protein